MRRRADPPDKRADDLREMIHIYAGLNVALDRWPEVSTAGFESTSTRSFTDKLCDLLGIDHVQATAVLEMQLRRVTRLERSGVARQLADLKAELTSLEREIP